ncbi:MAG: GcrA family cell cycle regulator [Maricaulaceae bacterium]
MAWTEDRVEILTKLWAEGLSASQIAKQLGGVTRNAVIGKVHRLGLSGRAKPSRPATRRAAAKPSTPRTRTVKPRASASAKPKTPSIPKIRSATESVPMPTPINAKPLPNGEFATILTIRDHMCKWPIGDPGDNDFRFCGRRIKEGEPYCEGHCQVAYQPSRRRGEKPKSLPMRPRNKYLPKRG